MRLILASASPRRKELLSALGLCFEVRPSRVEEDGTGSVPPSEAAAHALTLARRKAEDVAARVRAGDARSALEDREPGEGPRALVVAADTVVVLPDRVLGKPSDGEEAARMLRELAGREHRVVTAVVVTDPRTGASHGATVETKVFFRPLSDRAIRDYVATGEPADKAGAYAVQGVGSLLVERIEGDYFNVVGLPLVCLAELCGRFGFDLLAEAARRVAQGVPDGK